MAVHIKAPWEITLMRNAGRLLSEVITIVKDNVDVGVTTADLDRITEEEIRKRGAIPAFKGYQVGDAVFPASLCASRNEQIVHGIPDDKPLLAGDLISLDFGLHYGGYFADSAFSVLLGDPDPKLDALLDVTERALYEAIALAVPGNRVGDIGHHVEKFCEAHGYGVVRDFVGHGIGRRLHEDPAVPNFGKAGTGVPLKPGMCIAIEPMITLGTWEAEILDDGWTVVTADRSISAHFEHTVLITQNEPEILTKLV
jgi:methionyl aminopeptidase